LLKFIELQKAQLLSSLTLLSGSQLASVEQATQSRLRPSKTGSMGDASQPESATEFASQMRKCRSAAGRSQKRVLPKLKDNSALALVREEQ